MKNARDKAYRQTHLFEHFKHEGYSGFLGNVCITLKDKTDKKDPQKTQNY